jgi:hypothetical protein
MSAPDDNITTRPILNWLEKSMLQFKLLFFSDIDIYLSADNPTIAFLVNLTCRVYGRP